MAGESTVDEAHYVSKTMFNNDGATDVRFNIHANKRAKNNKVQV